MLLAEKKVKRVGVYAFFDSQGIVDRYVEFFLEDFSRNMDRLVIVSNGTLEEKERKKLKKYTEELIERENEGFDIWGYKTGMEYLGWETLETYDELVIANNTMMGPLVPLEIMFSDMQTRDVDFWGITRHYQFDGDPFGCNEYGYIPEHIQSYFMAFRRSIVGAADFRDYWKNMPMLRNYSEAVGLHETAFTKKFADKGYQWDTYVDTEDLKNLSIFPLMDYPTVLIRDKKCPIFKRRAFFQDYNNILIGTVGQPTVELYEYLRDYTSYDVDFIWETILRTCHQADFYKCMQLNYILSSEEIDLEKEYQRLGGRKVALFMHLFFDDLAENSLHYAMAMPDFADVYITTNTEEKKAVFEEKFRKLKCHKLEIRVVPNRGRDVSSLLVSLRDVLPEYEIACFYHDKKSGQVTPGSVGEAFGYKCAENVLYNKNFVCRILKTFEENPRLGLLSPPEPNHADYFAALGHEWFENYGNTKELAERLNLHVPMDPAKEPIAPLGSVFWFRVKAMEPLHSYPWTYEDFPEEPLPIDSTISHAIERIRPFAVQEAGYYPAFVMVDKFARIEFTNLRQYLRNYVHFLERHNMLVGTQTDIIRLMDERYKETPVDSSLPFWLKVAKTAERILPGKLYHTLIHAKRKVFGPHYLEEK